MRTLKDILRKSIVAVFTATIGIMPRRVQAAIKERIMPKGTLDYKNKSILMHVTCETQIMRLGACRKEPETVQWIESTIRPADVFYDIGANVGAYSFVADAYTDGKAKVYAFEPSFTTFTELSRNVLLNKASGRVFPFCVALSDTTQVKELHFSSIAPGAASHVLGENRGGHDEERQPVLCFTLDEFIERFAIERPTLMKIDVDGAEFQVLQGGARVLMGHRLRSVLVEVNNGQPDAQHIKAFMHEHGFVLAAEHQRSGNTVNCIYHRGNDG